MKLNVKMTHKEKLRYWKKHDPIHYSEMTSDPTGVSSNDGCLFEMLLPLIVIGGITLMLFLLSS